MVNLNVLSERYAGDEINEIQSEIGGILSERDLWIAVLKGQRELGLNIPLEAITAYENARNIIDLDWIKKSIYGVFLAIVLNIVINVLITPNIHG